ncbi:MAG: hypothetical protein AABZ06_11035 [Bdellovibrionota bacterium]
METDDLHWTRMLLFAESTPPLFHWMNTKLNFDAAKACVPLKLDLSGITAMAALLDQTSLSDITPSNWDWARLATPCLRWMGFTHLASVEPEPPTANGTGTLLETTTAFWRHRTGTSLSCEQAREAAANVVGFIKTLAGWEK